MEKWWIYRIEKKTELYVGVTTDLQNRMRQHGQSASLAQDDAMSICNIGEAT